MLPSSLRVRKEYFREIFKSGKFFPSKNLTIVVLETKELAQKQSRFSFSISSKVSGNAVDRNKLRRRGYAAVKDLILQIKPGFLAVFVLKKGAEKLNFEEYKKEIEDLLKKSSLTDR
ncbi:MAG: ribonuclease P protein component [Candidatus Paceibacterota bacterium]|nr:MAG: ribonuclease P protein component [Candidatus Paceibacterota bacterium]